MDKEKLKECKDAQEVLAHLKNELAEKRKAFDIENEELYNQLELAGVSLEDIKSNVRLEALAEFGESNNKKLLGGIGIRVRSVLEYDESLALTWAKLHSVAVVLDKKAFENIAKESKDVELGFVSQKEVPTVTFPKEILLEEDN